MEAGYTVQKFVFNNMSFTFYLPQRYVAQQMIGKGRYGDVIKGFDVSLKRDVVIKKINLPINRTVNSFVDLKLVIREIRIMRSIDHPNIVKLYDAYLHKYLGNFGEILSDVYLVLEYMECDISILLKQDQLTLPHIQWIMYQILNALHYLHASNIVHRDIKLNNILINANCLVKIADFGMSRHLDKYSKLTLFDTFNPFQAPEIMNNSPLYDTIIDMWSVGWLLLNLITNKMQFKSSSKTDTMRKIIEIIGPQSKEDIEAVVKDEIMKEKILKYSAQNKQTRVRDYIFNMFDNVKKDPLLEYALDLIEKLLVFNPHKRLSVTKATEHPFFNGMPKIVTQNKIDIDDSYEQSEDILALIQTLFNEMKSFDTGILNSTNMSALEAGGNKMDIADK